MEFFDDDGEEEIWSDFCVDLLEFEHLIFRNHRWPKCSERVFHGFQLWNSRWLARVGLSFPISFSFGLEPVDLFATVLGVPWGSKRTMMPLGFFPLWKYCGWFCHTKLNSVTTLH